MTPSVSCLALKEWAVTQRALDRGEQVILLRKGGIREEAKEFRVVEPEFLIYPTFEHQREDLLKPAYRRHLQEVLAGPHDSREILFTHWARVAEVVEVTKRKTLEALSPHHIWTTNYAEARLHWKPRNPLLVLVVRVFRLAESVRAPFASAYAGCKSWVRLEQEIRLGTLTPVLSEGVFRRRVEAVRREVRK